MSDTPESRAVAEAREQMRRALYLSPSSGGTMDADDAAIAAFESAVRAEERARVKALVDGAQRHFPSHAIPGLMIGLSGDDEVEDAVWVNRAALLAAIDGRE